MVWAEGRGLRWTKTRGLGGLLGGYLEVGVKGRGHHSNGLAERQRTERKE